MSERYGLTALLTTCESEVGARGRALVQAEDALAQQQAVCTRLAWRLAECERVLHGPGNVRAGHEVTGRVAGEGSRVLSGATGRVEVSIAVFLMGDRYRQRVHREWRELCAQASCEGDRLAALIAAVASAREQLAQALRAHGVVERHRCMWLDDRSGTRARAAEDEGEDWLAAVRGAER